MSDVILKPGDGLVQGKGISLNRFGDDVLIENVAPSKLLVAKITGVGSISVNYPNRGMPHSWTEMQPRTRDGGVLGEANGEGYELMIGGRSGTTTVSPAYELNGLTVSTDQLVFLRERGGTRMDTETVYDIVAVPPAAFSGAGAVGAFHATLSGTTYPFYYTQQPGQSDWDTDTFHVDTPDGFTGNSRFTIRETGYYHVGVSGMYATYNSTSSEAFAIIRFYDSFGFNTQNPGAMVVRPGPAFVPLTTATTDYINLSGMIIVDSVSPSSPYVVVELQLTDILILYGGFFWITRIGRL